MPLHAILVKKILQGPETSGTSSIHIEKYLGQKKFGKNVYFQG